LKTLPLIFLVLSATSAVAAPCFPFYKQKMDEIQKKEGRDVHVGSGFYIGNGRLRHNEGTPMAENIDNWAEDFLDAIEYGPKSFTLGKEDQRKKWLEAFKKSLGRDCKVSGQKYEEVRAMLHDLMSDGSFCPDGKIIEPGFLGSKKGFIRVFKAALEDKRLEQHCDQAAIKDETLRETKTAPEQVRPSGSKATGSTPQ
jgi:hypothetical protein